MPEEGRRKTVEIRSSVLARNQQFADSNRRLFREEQVLAVNIIGSPGSGKTTLLEAMAKHLGNSMVVIEGDIQTRRDADRIEKAGCKAYQIETHGACHLDAQAVSNAIEHLDLDRAQPKILVIENVGNLICPSSYDLGEHMKIGLLSVPEGDDKILKYPSLFSRVALLVINKVDLLPHIVFDIDRVVAECRSLNPAVETLRISAKTGQGVDTLCGFLMGKRSELLKQ